MSNLIQKTDQESVKHSCKLCDKSFPSGRSLGGHMRSHVMNSTHHRQNHHHDDDHQHFQQQQKVKMKKKKRMKLSSVNNGEKSMKNKSNSNDSGNELRKDLKKTQKVNDSSEVDNNSNRLVVLDKLCKECGKAFQSWKALFGHMKCHSEKVLNNHHTNSSSRSSNNNNNNNNNLSQDSWTSRSDNENSGAKLGGIKKSRSRNKRIKRYIVTSTTVTTTTITTASSSISMNDNDTKTNDKIGSNHASTSIVSEIEQNQESEIAMCLMMLSRDEGKWGNENESSDHCNSSAFVRLTKVEGKKPLENGSKIKKLAETQNGVDYVGRSELVSTGLEKAMIQNDGLDDNSELGYGKSEDSSKRKFECITCNKSFCSYQALGGHKASHRKLKESLDSKTEGENTIEDKPLFDHKHIINGYCAEPYDNHQKIKNLNVGANSLKKTVVLGAHECPICFKVFSSGQALGGHKRSHMIAEAKLNQQTSMNLIEKVNEPVPEIRAFLDLNMPPDTIEEDMIMNSSTREYNPWHWADANNHDSTTLLGLFSTI